MFDRILNMPQSLNMPSFWIYGGFWIYQTCKCRGSEYASGFEYVSVLDMSMFWMHHGSKYARVTQGFEYPWICLNNSWICLIMPYLIGDKHLQIKWTWPHWTARIKQKSIVKRVVGWKNSSAIYIASSESFVNLKDMFGVGTKLKN